MPSICWQSIYGVSPDFRQMHNRSSFNYAVMTKEPVSRSSLRSLPSRRGLGSSWLNALVQRDNSTFAGQQWHEPMPLYEGYDDA
jgi:hypothetical protein